MPGHGDRTRGFAAPRAERPVERCENTKGDESTRHNADPTCILCRLQDGGPSRFARGRPGSIKLRRADRKSTRLNSSHRCISYAVFCLKKKKKKQKKTIN